MIYMKRFGEISAVQRFLLVLVILFALLAVGMVGCTSKTKEVDSHSEHSEEEGEHQTPTVSLTREAIQTIGLTTIAAEEKVVSGTLTAAAKLVPNQDYEAQVGSLVQGRVHKVLVSVGDQVKQGQVLMQIESMEIGTLLSEFMKAKAELKFTDANRKRQKSLLEDNAGSQKSLWEAQTAYEKALADYSAVEKRIHSIGLSVSDMQDSGTAVDVGRAVDNGLLPIKAPISGTVIERTVVIGQMVDASSTAFRIVNTSTLWADGHIYESDAQRLVGKPEITLTVSAIPGERFRGKVIFISPVVDEHTRTITVRASIPNASGRLKPQMFGELHLPMDGTSKGIVVPAESVVKDNTVNFVFVAMNDTTFERREIQLGVAFDNQIEVKQGLAVGDRVVVKGIFELKSEFNRDAIVGDHNHD
ncbi:MAG: efflux RND transporter periplasmic adaptor subunit [bacterium]|nr:efflux RND transporter periplasmic adaptor subunit [bacterium]